MPGWECDASHPPKGAGSSTHVQRDSGESTTRQAEVWRGRGLEREESGEGGVGEGGVWRGRGLEKEGSGEGGVWRRRFCSAPREQGVWSLKLI